MKCEEKQKKAKGFHSYHKIQKSRNVIKRKEIFHQKKEGKNVFSFHLYEVRIGEEKKKVAMMGMEICF
jgi:hypothetical protein